MLPLTTFEDVQLLKTHLKEKGIKPGIGNSLIVHEALNRGLMVRGSRGGRAVLSRDSSRSYYWRNGVSNINHRLARQIVPQKEITSRILRTAHVLAGENAVFGPTDVERAWAWASFVSPLVVKPFNASQGRGVYVGVETEEEFRTAFEAVAQQYGEVLVENFLTGTEHRALVVDNKLVAVTRRVPAHVIGNGKSSLAELVREKNRHRGLIHKPLVVDQVATENLKRQDLSPESIPSDGQVVYLRRTSNLHTGGDAVDATDELTESEQEFVERAARAIPGLRVAGFDVLLPREPGDGAPAVLEVNPFPMISMHHFPAQGESRDVAGSIVAAMFPEA